MKIQVSEATPLQIDYLVAKIQGRNIVHDPRGLGRNSFFIWEDKDTGHKRTCYWRIGRGFTPTSDPAQGYPLIEKMVQDGYQIQLGGFNTGIKVMRFHDGEIDCQFGPTILIAGLRCFVISKLGEEAEVPDELA